MNGTQDEAWREIVEQLREQGTPEPLPARWRAALVAVWLLALAPGVLLLAAVWAWLANR